ncbi:MAG TPA: hypothetical protein DCZ01_01355 [Elusimicrobia bacterium]|nr:MAG: hypothetical protein A2X37_00495 [Elusimicrobia bacterium GWA2_66_18]HAZ07179.1 hypothetical protein [Elusimicrobiota bacterium]
MTSTDAARWALRVFAAALRGVLRGLGWLFLVAVLIVAGVGVYAYRRFNPETARTLAVEQLTALLRREVSIERLVLTPRGLKVRGLRVRRGRPGDGADDLLVCDSALITVKLRPLLHRRLEFDAVFLQSPQISLLRDAEGVWDLADVFVSSQTKRGTLPLALASAETVVEDAVLRVDDRLNGRKAVFEKFSLRVVSFDEEQSFPINVSFVSAVSFGTRTVTTTLSGSGTVDLAGLQWMNAAARIERFRAVVDGLAVTGSASVIGFSNARMEADISVPAVEPERWRLLTGVSSDFSLPATRWKARFSLPASGMLELESLSAESPAGTVSAAGLLDFAGPSPSLSLELSARDFLIGKAASWRPAWAQRSPSGRATLRAALTGWPGRLQAREAELSLRGFGASWGERRLEGLDLDASSSDEFSKIKVAVSKGRVAAFGAVFDEIALAMGVEKQNMVVERLAFRWGDSRIKLRARVEHLSAPKEVVLSGYADKLRWEDAQSLVTSIAAAISTRTRGGEDDPRPWVRTFKYAIPRGFPDTAGRVRVGELTQAHFWCKDLDLLWSLRGVTQDLDKASGEARVRLGAGRVSDIPTVQNSHKILRVIFLPFVYMHKMNNLSVFSTATAYPKTLDFSSIEGEYAVSEGVAETRYFNVDSSQLAAYADGRADFGREKVDMNILTRLTGYRGTLPEWWVDEAGRPAIGFRVKGDLNQPAIEPRFKKIGEGELERMVDEGRTRAKKRFEALEKIQTL